MTRVPCEMVDKLVAEIRGRVEEGELFMRVEDLYKTIIERMYRNPGTYEVFERAIRPALDRLERIKTKALEDEQQMLLYDDYAEGPIVLFGVTEVFLRHVNDHGEVIVPASETDAETFYRTCIAGVGQGSKTAALKVASPECPLTYVYQTLLKGKVLGTAKQSVRRMNRVLGNELNDRVDELHVTLGCSEEEWKRKVQ